MEFAHSLGFPHYELMLDQLTTKQYLHVKHYFWQKNRAREEAKGIADDVNLRNFLQTKMRRQQAELRT